MLHRLILSSQDGLKVTEHEMLCGLFIPGGNRVGKSGVWDASGRPVNVVLAQNNEPVAIKPLPEPCQCLREDGIVRHLMNGAVEVAVHRVPFDEVRAELNVSHRGELDPLPRGCPGGSQ